VRTVRTCVVLVRFDLPTLIKKPCRNAPNSDVDNGGVEPKDVGVGIFRPPRGLVRATVVHIGISRSFFYSVPRFRITYFQAKVFGKKNEELVRRLRNM
jgi:hypothetical protein